MCCVFIFVVDIVYCILGEGNIVRFEMNKSVLIPKYKGFLLDPFLRSVKNGHIKVLDDRFELVGDKINTKHLVIKNY